MVYDSKKDTQYHIAEVQRNLLEIIMLLGARARFHDASKLEPPEREMYDEFTPKLRALTYGSDEYKQCLKEMGHALQHHYESNSHHPEHFANGINGMSLLDLIEMLADWAAAVLRHDDGDLMESVIINADRFGMSDQLVQVLWNTVKELGWYSLGSAKGSIREPTGGEP